MKYKQIVNNISLKSNNINKKSNNYKKTMIKETNKL